MEEDAPVAAEAPADAVPAGKSKDSNLAEAFRLLEREELAAVDRDALQYDITMLEEVLEKMKPNMGAIAEYRQKEREYAGRVAQLDKATQDRDNTRKEYEAWRKKR